MVSNLNDHDGDYQARYVPDDEPTHDKDSKEYQGGLHVACYDIAYHMLSYASPLVSLLTHLDSDYLMEVQVNANSFMERNCGKGEWKRRKEMIDKRVLKNTELLLSCMIKIAEEGIAEEEDNE